MPAESPAPVEHSTSRFDPAPSGNVRGQVLWNGPLPAVPPFETRPNPLAGEVLRQRQIRPNPNAPKVAPGSRAVEGAVVFVRGINPEEAPPWDLPPVTIQQRGVQFHARQGSSDGAVGFVHRGSAVTLVSRDQCFHSLHAGGASFFTLAFPDPDAPLERRLMDKGLVELTSAAGYYWMRGYLFVDESPCYARTGPEGRFTLDRVPAGAWELVCWMPNWREARHERDPESGIITRLYFAPHATRTAPLLVQQGKTAEAHFDISEKDFPTQER